MNNDDYDDWDDDEPDYDDWDDDEPDYDDWDDDREPEPTDEQICQYEYYEYLRCLSPVGRLLYPVRHFWWAHTLAVANESPRPLAVADRTSRDRL